MARISVVVPVYNVEEYLEECLASLARQTVSDLEILLVDDGSTDGSAAIAEAFAARDERFRIIRQPNGGLGNARNNGADAATGEFLAFVDSDDVVPPNAYALLLASLDETGSDFATGNVHRLTSLGSVQAPFLARTFARTQPATHVTKFQALLADRIVPNKLWRRTFWDEHRFRFPEGMLNEDIPVVIPAHFLARSVDVISDPVYLYRIREGGDLSITQRRAELRALRDRMTAVEMASAFLGEHGPRHAKRWYDESVAADDIRYYLNVLESTDDEYRELFLDRVNAFLDGLGRRRPYRKLLAIDRLKYHFVRRRLMPELLEVLRFQREDMIETPPVRSRGRWYGDYPFRGDRRLNVPRWVYRLDTELPLAAQVDELRWEGDELHVAGYAFIRGIGAEARGAQRVSVSAVRPGRLRRVRLQTVAVRFRTSPTHRPDATADARESFRDVSWSGFEARLKARRLRLPGRWRYGAFDIYVTVRAAGVRRRRVRFALDPARPLRTVERPMPDGTMLKAVPTPTGRVAVQVQGHWAVVRGHRIDGDALELTGDIRMPAGAKLKLEAAKTDGSATRDYPLKVAGDGPIATFSVRLALEELRAEEALEVPWLLSVARGERRHRVAFPSDAPPGVWQHAGREFSLHRTQQGDAVLADRRPRPVVTDARWRGEGVLELEGDLHAREALELVLVARDYGEQYPFALDGGAPDRRFAARITPARVPSLAGELPLRETRWDLMARPAGALGLRHAVPVMLAESVHDRLPLATVVDHKPFALGSERDDTAVLVVQSDLAEEERGPYHQRRLRDTAYAARRGEPLIDAVVYASFGGRQYSDSPRAIHEELVRRGAPLEHLWVVRDGQANVPAGAGVLREGSREHHEALARARYVVANDHFPEWFSRRDDQVCLQTWHGTPLKRLGFDVSAMHKTKRRFERHWDEQVRNWQHVVSPNHFSTPILRRAYRLEGEMLETGYPRVDALVHPDRDERGRQLRERLGLPEGVRTILYAPTFRDQVIDRRGRYRMDLRLDVERLRAAVGPDTVILFRKHHYIADPVPVTADGFVRDVSSHPDGTELLLAADVLVTDYSSMMFDFANTGRPMLFFTYDLDAYRDEIRGFYFDFLERAPGPLLRTGEELAAALADLDGVRARFAQRYAAFVAAFCELDDGGATARVVDSVFT